MLRNKSDASKYWDSMRHLAKQQNLVGEFDQELLGRFNGRIRSSKIVQTHFQNLLNSNEATIRTFFGLAKTYRIQYYKLAELERLIKDFSPFMGKIDRFFEDVSCYDQGGLDRLRAKLIPISLGNVSQAHFTLRSSQTQTSRGRLFGIGRRFSEADEVRLSKIIRQVSGGKEKEKALIYWYCQIKDVLGDTVFTLLSRPERYKGIEVQRLMKLLQNVLQLEERIDKIIGAARPFFNGKIHFKFFFNDIQLLLHNSYKNKYADKSAKELREAFSNEALGVPLDQVQLEHIFSQYEQLEKLCKEVRLLSHAKLVDGVTSIRAIDKPTEPDRLRLIAIARESIRIHFGIYPYKTQVLALLGLINFPDKMKGRIAQVRTGEGKSTIITMLAFYQACLGRKVDVVSSSRYLSLRDYKKYREFYGKFGITTSHLCTNRPTKENFSGQLIFGTNTDFEFGLMREQLWSYNQRFLKMDSQEAIRPREVVIVDEVDNLFFDSALNSAILAIPARTQYTWVFKPLYELVSYIPLPPFLLLGLARSLLSHLNDGKYRKLTEAISDERLLRWLQSAHVALRERQLKRDYEIIPIDEGRGLRKQIVIVDKDNTGRLKIGSRWQNGLHEFLEVKHGLAAEEESVTPASICHPIYFGAYQHVFGLTGTIGSQVERNELGKIYRVDTFDVPTHKPCQRKILPAKVFKGGDAYHQRILEEVKAMRQAHRPVLVLLETIEETERLSNILKGHSIPFQLLNERQSENEDYVVAKAGAPGIVTIATNTAGRGTDIIVHSSSLRRGGLHMIFGFLPANDRVEQQGFGRAGRQGQKGSCRMILHSDKTYDELLKQREEKISKQSRRRLAATERERIKHCYLAPFLARLGHWRSALDRQFMGGVRKKIEQALSKGVRPKVSTNLDLIEMELAKAFHPEGGEHLLDQFLEAVKEHLERDLLLIWGEKFYDEIGHLPEESYQEAVERRYQSCKLAIDKQFVSPQKSFCSYVERLIGISIG